MTGRSDRLGWGLTSSYLDDQDVHIEQLNPDNPEEYLTPDGYKEFQTRPSIIEIKGRGPDHPDPALDGERPGPARHHYNLETITPPGHVASLSWTALSPRDTSMTASMALMNADTVREAIEVGETVHRALAEPVAGRQGRRLG